MKNVERFQSLLPGLRTLKKIRTKYKIWGGWVVYMCLPTFLHVINSFFADTFYFEDIF